MTQLELIDGHPGLSIQDLGRPGYLGQGLSQGGAADPLALHEGAALLDQDPGRAALEMAGRGGRFRVLDDVVIALTGAEMQASCAGQRLQWNSTHLIPAGKVLEIGGARSGIYGYLHVPGGFDTARVLDSRSWHSTANLGAPLGQGSVLPVAGTGGTPGRTLDIAPRGQGGTAHMVESAQTAMFPPEEQARFQATAFTRDIRGNRQGARFAQPGEGFGAVSGLSILSEVIVPGDIQISGDGAPYVLLADCQTTGGYPRIGTVLPCDLPLVAQTPPGAPLRFKLLSLEAALARERALRAERDGLPKRVRPLVRDPSDIADLLSVQLISGVTAGEELP